MDIDAIRHGTVAGYAGSKCRCDDCRAAIRDYDRARREARSEAKAREPYLNDLLGDLLHELCPDGLTDDAPIRRARRKAAA